MSLRIALAGNPNSGKTTLFNALTGSNQFVGNWPGVTVEKKEGKLKKHDGVIITDLPGIYSLSPYTLEEVVARNYLIGERPDAILNIVDGTNLERNLYLTTQLTELGIPVVIAINMMDVVRKNGDKINTAELSRQLGCKIVEISALKGTGIMEAAEAAIDAAKNGKTVPMHTFSGCVEHAIAHIEEAAVHSLAGALFGGSALVATSAYFIGMAAIIVSGIMLKKTKMFAGDPAPFVMELPAYHLPTVSNVLRSMWERGWSFIKKAGTVILLSTIVVWFTSYFGVVDGTFRMLAEDELDKSLLAAVGGAVCWIFKPLGWGTWQATVASITGLVAKENIVGTMGILYGAEGHVWATLAKTFTGITGYSFLVFNLLCAPCFAAIGAIKREMNNAKWTWFAIGYQCGFAYAIALMINQFGNLFTGRLVVSGDVGTTVVNIVSLVAAFALLGLIVYMLVRPYKEATKLTEKVKVSAK